MKWKHDTRLHLDRPGILIPDKSNGKQQAIQPWYDGSAIRRNLLEKSYHASEFPATDETGANSSLQYSNVEK